MIGRRRINPSSLYQIDFSAQSSGKTFGATKRAIKFCFGFADPQALSQGCLGADCRGEEHELLLIWSITSGKQTILLDGKEINRVVPKSGGGCHVKMEYDFYFGKNHEHLMKLIAHASTPVVPIHLDGSEQRQFELYLDGLSFFDFYKLFELGCYSSKKKKVRFIHNAIAVAEMTNQDNNSALVQEYNMDSAIF